MLRNRVRISSFAVIILLVALLSGCGGATESKDIKIGGNYEITGGLATFAQSSCNGIKLAFKEVNAAGGILGKQITFIIADNKSEPSEATNAITKLITQDKVISVLGAVASSNTLAAAQVATDSKIPFITPSSTNPKVTFDNGAVREFAFRTCFIDPFQGTVMANFAVTSLKAKTAAIYVDASSDYSKGLAQFFEEAFVKSGGRIIATESYQQKDQDFKATLTKLKSLNPEIIFIPGYYEEVGKIVKQARELTINVPLLGGDGWDSPRLQEIAGNAALNNTFFCDHYSAEDNDPRVVKFIEGYKKEYGQVPDSAAALGYDTALMLIDAIKRANSTDPVKIKDAIAQTKSLQVVSGSITVDANHNPVKSAVILEMKDGKKVFKGKINP